MKWGRHRLARRVSLNGIAHKGTPPAWDGMPHSERGGRSPQARFDQYRADACPNDYQKKQVKNTINTHRMPDSLLVATVFQSSTER